MKTTKVYFDKLNEIIDDYIDYEITKELALEQVKQLELDAAYYNISFHLGVDFFDNMERDSSYAPDDDDEDSSYGG